MTEVLAFVIAALAVGVVGVVVGMLVAPRLSRIGEADDEDPGDRDDPDPDPSASAG